MEAAVVSLGRQRCLNHPQREASARCPECGRFYCRECITEHDDRVLCASCLARLSSKQAARTEWRGWIPKLALALIAWVIVFVLVLVFGDFLLSIPSHFHEKGGW